jgi:hypothetical protein
MAGLAGDELVAADAALATARAEVLSLQEGSRAGDEAYAMLSQEDAEGRVGLLELETKQRANHIANLEAESTFERGLLTQYAADQTDSTKTEAERAFAAEQFILSDEHIAENQKVIDENTLVLSQIADEL